MRLFAFLAFAGAACGNVPAPPPPPDGSVDSSVVITYTSHTGDGTPINTDLVAFQDGDGPWQAVAGTGGVYTFRVSSQRYGLAAACLRAPDGSTFVSIQLATTADPRARYGLASCAKTMLVPVAISGSSSGIPMGQQLLVSSGSSSSLGPAGAWNTTAVAGPGTLVATSNISQRPTSIITRKVNYATGATFALDFATGFAPAELPLMIDPTATQSFMSTSFIDEDSGIHQIDVATGPVATHRVLPVDRLGGGVSTLSVSSSAGGASRSVERAFKVPASQAVIFPATYLPVDVPRTISGPPTTIETTFARTANASYYRVTYFASAGTALQSRELNISSAWAAAAPGANVTLRIPDLSSVAGYVPAFATPTANVTWNLMVATGPARLAAGAFGYRFNRPAEHLAAGEESTSSSSNGTVR